MRAVRALPQRASTSNDSAGDVDDASVSPALVVVGALMIAQIRHIDLTRFEVALPCFLTIVVMPFTYSIANGIGVGFISWVVLATARGKVRSVHPLLWVVAVLFVLYFAKGPIESLIDS